MNRNRTSHQLQRTFFIRSTLEVAPALLGKLLVRVDDDRMRLSGIIVETEAYIGQQDLGCHARSGKTKRNASMWGAPGFAYVYLTYGMHWMLNFVTEAEGFPAAVLIRAIVPQEGVDRIRRRRNWRPDRSLTNGPAKLCQALAIDRAFDRYDLCQPSSRLFIEHGLSISPARVTTGPRVGLNTVPEPWKSMPWRFRISQNDLQNIVQEGGQT
ncbi:MAG: DNA-3-methyladenine glycosylase [Anaerolineales bacterium]|nr:DNA-3-methyladenine glycosylase [Anaerolineales bacterium]